MEIEINSIKISFTAYAVNSIIGLENVPNSLINKNGKEIRVITGKYKFDNERVYDVLKDLLIKYDYKISGVSKRIKDGLLISGLNAKKYNKVNELSDGEKVLFELTCGLVLNSRIFIFGDVFHLLDKSAKDMLVKLFRMLKSKYKKTIIIFSNDVNFLHLMSDNYTIIKDNSILLEGNKKIFYEFYDILVKNDIEVPKIVSFTKLILNKKGVKLHERFDVKDLMKDIYRSV